MLMRRAGGRTDGLSLHFYTVAGDETRLDGNRLRATLPPASVAVLTLQSEA